MLKLFTKPIFRHLTAGILILIIALGIGWFFGSNGKAELKGELTAVLEEVELLRYTVSEMAKTPKLHVENNVQDVKVKDGSALHFVPKTDIKQLNKREQIELNSFASKNIESFKIKRPPDNLIEVNTIQSTVTPLTKKQKRRMKRIIKRERRLEKKLMKLKKSTL